MIVRYQIFDIVVEERLSVDVKGWVRFYVALVMHGEGGGGFKT